MNLASITMRTEVRYEFSRTLIDVFQMTIPRRKRIFKTLCSMHNKFEIENRQVDLILLTNTDETNIER